MRAEEGHVRGERVERRLAAILAADVAGYSRMMGQDEAGTLTRLKAVRRELVDPEIAEHGGRGSSRRPATAYWSSFRASSRQSPVRSPCSAQSWSATSR